MTKEFIDLRDDCLRQKIVEQSFNHGFIEEYPFRKDRPAENFKYSDWKGISKFEPLESLEFPKRVPFLGHFPMEQQFGLFKELHYPADPFDTSVKNCANQGNLIVNVVAPSSTGKTAGLFRYLCTNYGFYMTCSSRIEENSADHGNDFLALEFHRVILSLSQDDLLLWAPHISRLVVISKLCDLLYRVRYNGEIPLPDTFLRWQINGQTREAASLFLHLFKQNAHQCDLTSLVETIEHFLALLITELKISPERPPPFFLDEAQVYCKDDCLQQKHVVTESGTIRQDVLLSHLTSSLYCLKIRTDEKNHVPSIFFNGTGFSSPHLLIAQSASETKDTIREIAQIIGHPLVETPDDAINLLQSVVTLPAEYQELLHSHEFRTFFPARRRFLMNCMKRWMQNTLNRSNQDPMETARGVQSGTIARFTENLLKIEPLSLVFDSLVSLQLTHNFKCKSDVYKQDLNRRQIFDLLTMSSICEYYTASGSGATTMNNAGLTQILRFSIREKNTRQIIETFQKTHSEQWRAPLMSKINIWASELSHNDDWENVICALLHANSCESRQLIEDSWTTKEMEESEDVEELDDVEVSKDVEGSKRPGWRERAHRFLDVNMKIKISQLITGTSELVTFLRQSPDAPSSLIQILDDLPILENQKDLPTLDTREKLDDAILIAGGQDPLLAYLFKHELIHLLVGCAFQPCKNAHIDLIIVVDLMDREASYQDRYGLLLVTVKKLNSTEKDHLRRMVHFNTNQAQVDYMYRSLSETSLMEKAGEDVAWIPNATPVAHSLVRKELELYPRSGEQADEWEELSKKDRGKWLTTKRQEITNKADSLLVQQMQKHPLLPCSVVIHPIGEKLGGSALIKRWDAAAVQINQTSPHLFKGLNLNEIGSTYYPRPKGVFPK